MHETPDILTTLLQIAFVVVVVIAVMRWRLRGKGGGPRRDQHVKSHGVTYMPAGSGDRFNAGAGVDDVTSKLDPSLERELSELLRAGRKIDAIKRVREHLGLDLKDAKDFVERL